MAVTEKKIFLGFRNPLRSEKGERELDLREAK